MTQYRWGYGDFKTIDETTLNSMKKIAASYVSPLSETQLKAEDNYFNSLIEFSSPILSIDLFVPDTITEDNTIYIVAHGEYLALWLLSQ